MTTRAAVHQFVPVLRARDAVGAHSLRLRELLRGMGLDSEIYTADAGPDVGTVRHPHELASQAGRPTYLVYQASTASDMADQLLARPEPLVLNYHNITPADDFQPWEPLIATSLRAARRQLARLARHARLGISDSSFNAAELTELGCPESVVAPILFDVGAFDVVADGRVLSALSGGSGSVWLFVGRLAPNKAQHDVVRAFALYRRVFEPGARLFLVGGSSSDRYERALRALVEELDLGGSVVLAGGVSEAELAAYYEGADVFVCLSDHEGFCVPLLEAMFHGLPVVAFGSSAVPETLGSGGLCLPEKSPGLVASAVWRVVSDGGVRDGLVEAGRRRLADFDLARTRATFTTAIERFVHLAGASGAPGRGR